MFTNGLIRERHTNIKYVLPSIMDNYLLFNLNSKILKYYGRTAKLYFMRNFQIQISMKVKQKKIKIFRFGFLHYEWKTVQKHTLSLSSF